QISVLSAGEKLIDAATLAHYLPSDGANLPAIYHAEQQAKESFSERDILYKVLFEMKNDVTELKKLVLGILENESINSDLLEDHKELFNSLEEKSQTPASFLLDFETKESSKELKVNKSIEVEENSDIQDIIPETEDDESLSLEKKEKELILKALQKNNNKRKYAARDLGISERTLYRKIKHYELEEE
ncbi:MAG: helix-turn-helix domain-containing protein, partial [Cyclobacteriaceae bacterium]|nr:helix-turn-helix domain-containing protein [Cyclobacteriaceae bacterium]